MSSQQDLRLRNWEIIQSCQALLSTTQSLNLFSGKQCLEHTFSYEVI